MPQAPRVHKRKAVGKRHGVAPQTNRQATRALNTGSKRWRYLRQRILVRDMYTCADCGRYGNQVDHVDGDSHNNDEVNLRCRCLRCHSRKTAGEKLNRS